MEHALGRPHRHLRRIDSTNRLARELAAAGAPHGTLVTADAQTAGRGRQGRRWEGPAGRALLASIVLRDPPPRLALVAGLAVAELAERVDAAGRPAVVKWPNDVLLVNPGDDARAGGKVAGILVEGRPQERWAVLGIGLNVAVEPADLPAELRPRVATLGRAVSDLAAVLGELLDALAGRLATSPGAVLVALRERDALRDRPIAYTVGASAAPRTGVAAGIDDDGRLLVATDSGTVALDAAEVHLT